MVLDFSHTRGTFACLLIGVLGGCSDNQPASPDLGSSGGTSGGASGAPSVDGGAGPGGGAGPVAGSSGAAGTTGLVPFTGRQLFGFDFVDTGTTYGWTTTATPASGGVCPNATTGGTLELINEDRDPNNSTPGALRFNAQFPAYDQFGVACDVQALLTYGDATTGTNTTLNGGTMLHFWFRLVSPPPTSGVDFAQPFIQGGTASAFANNFGFIDPFDPVGNPAGTGFLDNEWHEFILDLSAAYAGGIGVIPYVADVWRLGLSLRAVLQGVLPPPAPDADAGMATDAGTDAGATDGMDPAPAPAPAPLIIDIDDIFLE